MSYFIKKIVAGLFLILGILIGTFFLTRMSPGNPAVMAFDPKQGGESVRILEEELGLKKPIAEQFLSWSADLLQGDWGVSYSSHRPVMDVIRETLPNTLILTLSALFVQVLGGILIGMLQILYRDSILDKSLKWITLTLYAVPGFWVALLLIMIFSETLNWLPSSQMMSYYIDRLSSWQQFLDRVSHLILPVLSLSLISMAFMARYVRQCLVDVMEQEYILAARARGLSEKRIISKHMFKNILVPVVTLVGQHFPALVGSSIVIEIIFSWPGMGRLIVLSTFARDYPIIIACTFIMAVFVVLGNLLADFLCALLDPRIRLQPA